MFIFINYSTDQVTGLKWSYTFLSFPTFRMYIIHIQEGHRKIIKTGWNRLISFTLQYLVLLLCWKTEDGHNEFSTEYGSEEVTTP